jgi:competence protein ComEC
MAKGESPGAVSERSLFAPADAAFVMPVPVPPKPLPPDAAHGRLSGVKHGAIHPSRMPAPAKAWAALRGRLPALPKPAATAKAASIALSLELDRGIGFLLAPVFMAAGALVYFWAGSEPGLLPIGACTLAAAALVPVVRSRPLLQMAIVALLLCLLGALFAKLETWRAGTKVLGGEVTTRLTGQVLEVERMANGRVRLVIDVMGTSSPVLRYAPDRVRISARSIPDTVSAGTAVTGLVRLMPPAGPVRPDSYDFSFESYFDGIGATGFFLKGPELAGTAEPAGWGTAFRSAVERIRHRIASHISGQIGGPEGEIAAALVVGVRGGIPEDVNDALRRAGIYHIISISGLHMALVAGTIMGLLRAGFALLPGFSSRHPVKKYAAAIALVGLAGYLFISGGEVAAQRSFIMLAVMLVAVLFDRSALTMRNLAIAAIIVLILSPHEVVGPSFQMSFAATAGLVGAYAAWSDRRQQRSGGPPGERTWLRRLVRALLSSAAGLALTSIVAGGATAIYAAWHFQQMPTLGLFTNLTAMPIVSFVVMPFAVLGALLMPAGLDGPFFHVMGQGLQATIAIARWFAERTPNDTTGLVSSVPVALLTVALIAATVTTTWLRIVAVPLALSGLLLVAEERAPPDFLVSEDGRLVAARLDDGRLATNRPKPNEFTIDNWKRAMLAEELIRPDGRQQRPAGQQAGDTKAGAQAQPPAGSLPAAPADEAGSRQFQQAEEGETQAPPRPAATAAADIAAHSATGPDRAEATTSDRSIDIRDAGAHVTDAGPAAGFKCTGSLCTVRSPAGLLLVHALDAQSAVDYCATADIIVVADVATRDLCRWRNVLVMDGRDLALSGSAEITLPDGRSPIVRHAIARPYRPWHEHRRFSRAARGLPQYRPSSGTTKQELPVTSTSRTGDASPPTVPTATAPTVSSDGSARPASPEP